MTTLERISFACYAAATALVAAWLIGVMLCFVLPPGPTPVLFGIAFVLVVAVGIEMVAQRILQDKKQGEANGR
ncbi:MAG TPA: hypothetical protein PL193_07755 [Xanthobacteraceae bacterium]|nr:hypothetical protein [Xanthobacteraceae bacterium]